MIAVLQHRVGEWIQDRYEILSILGSGAYGTVYHCRDRELGTPVAIKELHVLDDPAASARMDEREAALAQFRQEAVHLSQLRHPHIVWGHYQPHNGTWLACPRCGHTFRGRASCPQHGAAPIVLKQRHYLVMEYVDGSNLAQRAESHGGKLEVAAAVRYIRQIAEALRLVHERGWVHRDIKPENIRVRLHPDEAVLLDFGIATETGVAGQYSTRRMRNTAGGGTLGYAPEASDERLRPDARSDIHALGMTLYRLLSGLDPQEPADLDLMRDYTPRHFNPAVTPPLEEIILKSIDPLASRRPCDAEEFLESLDRAIAPRPPDKPAAAPPLTFRTGDAARNPQELVVLMDRYPREARDYLYNGDVAHWLANIGRVDLAGRAREICLETPYHKYQGVEAFLQFTGLVEPPSLEIEPNVLDFGVLRPGQRKAVTLHLHNTGRGLLFGEVRSTDLDLEFISNFEGNTVKIQIAYRPRNMERGRHDGEIVIDSSAGEWRLPFTVAVRGDALNVAAVSILLWAVLGMLGGELLRTLPVQEHPGLRYSKWLPASTHLPWGFAAPIFGLVTWALLFLLVIAEATRRRSFWVMFTGGWLSLAAAFLIGSMGNDLLVAGDVALKPYLVHIAHQWAAGGWMFVGGIAGAVYGTLRRWSDLFALRLVPILLGWLCALVVIYAVLIGVLTTIPAYR